MSETANTTKKPAPGQTKQAVDGPTYDRADFANEFEGVRDNRNVGTTIWFENDRVQIWDLSLEPGERLPFHTHDQDYFWTVTDPSRMLQRFDDGTSRIIDASVGDTNFLTYGDGERTVHDIENVGDTFFRCLTVVLK
jgi:quercetin dioxygenase-like cupin family protein